MTRLRLDSQLSVADKFELASPDPRTCTFSTMLFRCICFLYLFTQVSFKGLKKITGEKKSTFKTSEATAPSVANYTTRLLRWTFLIR